MKASSVLILPCVLEGRGSGHLKRSLALRRSLEKRGAESVLALDRGLPGERSAASLASSFSIGEHEWMPAAEALGRGWDIAAFDNFSTPWAEFEVYRRRSFCLGIDEGGPARGAFDYLVDILPRVGKGPPPNLADALRFLDLPPRSREFPERIRKVLVSMGGEDRPGLGPVLARLAARSPSRPAVELLTGPLFAGTGSIVEGIHILGQLPNLKDRLADYDLVICQFGLTAYEALAGGTAVLLKDPSPYHRALARAAGFPSLGYGKSDAGALESFLAEPARLLEASRRPREALRASTQGVGTGRGPDAMAEFILGMELPGLSSYRACVACAADKKKGRGKALWRDEGRSYFPCPSCASIRLSRTAENPISYGESYFFEEYRRQYGKTYLEDLPNLRRMAGERLDAIEALSGPVAGKRVLDIGCAYGAFLLEARERGCEAFGIDPASEAVGYLRDVLSIDALRGYFPDSRLSEIAARKPFDVVSMWYVAEHLPDLRAALDSIGRLMRKGGVLAISTPSASGVSARFSADSFFASSPYDHASILSPSSARRAFADSGFRLRATRSTGHHPERFPLRRRVTGGAKYVMLLAASRLFALGDTFEAYASRT